MPAVAPVPAELAKAFGGLVSPKASDWLPWQRTTLRWKRVARATGYNVQVFRGRRRVMNAWSRDTRLRVPFGVLKQGRTYVWVVWPANGPPPGGALRAPGRAIDLRRHPAPAARLPHAAGAAASVAEVRPHIPFGALRLRRPAGPRGRVPSVVAINAPRPLRPSDLEAGRGAARRRSSRTAAPSRPWACAGRGAHEPPRSRAPPEDASGALIHQGPASAASGARTPLRRITERTTNRAITSTSATAARSAPRGDRGRRRGRPRAALQRRLIHREAPSISQDPTADNTDVYAFRSPDAPDTATLVANFVPFEEPAGGPNFYRFSDDVKYEIKVDNTGDARPDVTYEFRFDTTTKNPAHVPLQQRHDHVRRQERRVHQPQPGPDLHRPQDHDATRRAGRTSRRSAGIS